jgi:hypothetical protein
MTYTVSTDIQGTRTAKYFRIVMTGVTTAHIMTGLGMIEFVSATNQTALRGLVQQNVNAAGDAVANGGLRLSGFTAGDVVVVKVEGV